MKTRIALFCLFLVLELLCPVVMFFRPDFAHFLIGLVLWTVNWCLFIDLLARFRDASILRWTNHWAESDLKRLFRTGTSGAVFLAVTSIVCWMFMSSTKTFGQPLPFLPPDHWFRWWEIAAPTVTWLFWLGLRLAVRKPARDGRDYRAFADQFDESC